MMPVCTRGVLLLSGDWGFVEVARVPVWQRAILSGLKAGITHWLVLTWEPRSRIQASFATEPRLRTISYHIVEMHHADIDDLRKLLPTDETPEQDVIVVPGHVVFNYPLLQGLQKAQAPTLGVMQTTWARAQAPPPAAGLLRLSGPGFSQLLDNIWHAMSAASDPIQAVVAECLTASTLRSLDLSPYVWVPLTEPVASLVTEAEAQLLRRLGREGDSLVIRLIARRISRTITRWLLPTRIRPNHMTLVSGLIGLCGALLLADGTVAWQVLGSLLFLLSTIIDGCDGELARLTFQESTFGAKLDVTMDNVVHGVLFPAIAVGQYRQHQDSLYLVLGVLALGGVVVSMLVFLPYILRPQKTRTAETRLHESLASRDFAYVLPILAVWQQLGWFLWATAIGTYVFAAAWLVITWRQRRQRKLLPQD